jgi:hypothetical protein
VEFVKEPICAKEDNGAVVMAKTTGSTIREIQRFTDCIKNLLVAVIRRKKKLPHFFNKSTAFTIASIGAIKICKGLDKIKGSESVFRSYSMYSLPVGWERKSTPVEQRNRYAYGRNFSIFILK